MEKRVRESVLRDFFQRALSASNLEIELTDVLRLTPEGGVTVSPVADFDEDFKVLPTHLVHVCDAVLSGELSPSVLPALALTLVASDGFHWNGETEQGGLVAETVFDWACPEINYPLRLQICMPFARV